MAIDKHLLNKFMDKFGEIKLAYWVSVEKQNKLIRKFIDRIHQLNDGFMVNDAVLAELLAMMPQQFRLSAKASGLNVRTKEVCQNIFADQMDILYHGVKHGWNSCGDYPYSHHEMIIFASECLAADIEAIELQMLAAPFKTPNQLAEACEQVLDSKILEHTKRMCDFYSNSDRKYATKVLRLQKNLFCDALKGAWNQTFLLSSLNMGEHENKGDERIASLLANKQKARAKRYSKKAMLLKSAREQSDKEAETFFQGLESSADDSEQKEDVKKVIQNKADDTALPIKRPEAGGSFRLCDPADVQSYLASFGRGNKVVPDKDDLTQVQQQEGMVSLTMVPVLYRDVLMDFRVRFPNMIELADMIEDILNLATLGGIDTPLQLASDPIILVGPPGTGKTMGLHYLSEQLGIAFKMIGCAELSNGFDISGSSRGWGSGKPGMIARMLLHEGAANGIIVLDELDKCHTSESNYPPTQALYTLLERETAAHFKDEYFDFEMDASRINWMATANDYARIPEPLRDRAIKVCIAPPTIRQRLSIAGYLYQDLRLQHESAWGRFFTPELDPAVAWMLASVEGISIRGMKKNIMACLATVAGSGGKAMEHGSLYVSEADAFKVIGKRPNGMPDSDTSGFLH